MKVLVVIALLLLALAAVEAHPVRVLKGARPPVDWSVVSSAASTERVHFFLSLPQQNLAELERRFWAVSNPDSDEYGQFLSVDEIQSIVSPPHSERQALKAWLTDNGVSASDILDYGDSFEVDTTASIASSLFDAQFYVYEHADGRRVVRAEGDVSLPTDVASRVEMVYGLTGFPVPHLSAHRRSAVTAPGQRIIENDAIIPQSLYQMYGLPKNTTVGTSSGIGQGVIEWEGESFRPIDLLWYASNTSLNGAPVYPEDQIIGNDPHEAGGESTLDVDMIVGVAPANTNWFWLETNQSAWLYSFAVHFLNATKVPDVISISYGWYEGDQCENGIGGAECQELSLNSTQFVQRVNTEWMKIGARGVTITVSSGDSGSHTRSDGECQAPTLLADYPASSPYITSVGATQVENGTYFDPAIAPPACRTRRQGQLLCISGGTEVAVSVDRAYFTSGGGFSNISAQQSYQTTAVAHYLAQKEVPLPPAHMFNAKGRAYPDVSAVGHNGYTIAFGEEELSGGTSQSSPIFAGIIALLSVEYKKITGNTFGFINPLLYQMYAANPAAFNDVVSGSNICTEDGCAKSCKGFTAAKGWDPVTGLGTPNYPTMLAYVQQLAHKVVARRAAKAATTTKDSVYVVA